MQALHDRGHKHVLKIDDPSELPDLVSGISQDGDLVIFLGAGTITQWAYALPQQLAERGDV